MYKLYSQRIRSQNGSQPGLLYHSFSYQFRNQLFFIVADVYDRLEETYSRDSWKYLHDSFARELGVKRLNRFDTEYGEEKKSIEGFITEAPEVEIIDFMDFTFAVIYSLMNRPEIRSKKELRSHLEKAIRELNHRFEQHGLGYEFAEGTLHRRENRIMQREVLTPALRFLLTSGFTEAELELANALEHRHRKEYPEAVALAFKALESTIRAICRDAGCAGPGGESTESLLTGLVQSSMFPGDAKTQINALRAALEVGGMLPGEGSDEGGPAKASDGAGPATLDGTAGFVDFGINLAATHILYLTQLYHAKHKREQESTPEGAEKS